MDTVVLVRASVCPNFNRAITVRETPERVARSSWDQFSKARAARIWAAKTSISLSVMSVATRLRSASCRCSKRSPTISTGPIFPGGKPANCIGCGARRCPKSL